MPNVDPKVAGLTLKSGNPLTATFDAVVIATTTDNKFSIFSDGPTKYSWGKSSPVALTQMG